MNVLRTSGSVICDLAVTTALPSVVPFAPKTFWTTKASKLVCGEGWFRPLEASTATAPPLGATIKVTASGCAYTSWKNPFRQSMIRNTGNCDPLVSEVTEVVSKISDPDH